MIQNPTILSNYSIFVTETFKDFQCDTNTNMCKKVVHMYWNISTESHANRKKEEKRALLRREMSLQKFWFRVFGCGCGSVIHRYIYTVVPFLFPPPTYVLYRYLYSIPFYMHIFILFPALSTQYYPLFYSEYFFPSIIMFLLCFADELHIHNLEAHYCYMYCDTVCDVV